MPIPFIIGGVALALGATGLAKGAGALSDMSDVQDVGSRAERKHRKKLEEVDKVRQATNNELARLGKLKVDIGKNQLQHVINVIAKLKSSSSTTLRGFDEKVMNKQLPQISQMVTTSLSVDSGLASGLASGVLVGMGAYGSVGMLATASTGTAISTLSGAAATNATLAWLGGGSLAAGGFGMAGGTLVLGGIVTAPALAVAGFMMASKAEEAMTEAKRYSNNVDLKVAELDKVIAQLEAITKSAKELQYVLLKTVSTFEKELKISLDEALKPENDKKVARMLDYTINLIKPLLDMPAIKDDGSAYEGVLVKYDGLLKITHQS